jgi:hypothetical protein
MVCGTLQATYQWFASLQTLLGTEQNWVKQLRYHPDRGFFHARDAEGKRYLLLDNKVLSNIPGRTDSLPAALRQFDMTFETCWFCGSFLDPIWSAAIPEGHIVALITKAKQQHSDIPDNTGDPIPKRIKLGGKKSLIPDFISSTTLMDPVVPLPPNTKSTTMTMLRRINAPIPFPRLASTNGTLQTICLNSAFPKPYNCCILKLCGDKKMVPPTPRLHIDLNAEPWRSKPESYWNPMVTFLQNEQIQIHLRPSKALKLLTPNTQ